MSRCTQCVARNRPGIAGRPCAGMARSTIAHGVATLSECAILVRHTRAIYVRTYTLPAAHGTPTMPPRLPEGHEPKAGFGHEARPERLRPKILLPGIKGVPGLLTGKVGQNWMVERAARFGECCFGCLRSDA